MGTIVLRHEVLIAASAERVWSVLVDLPAYAEWNPWLVRAEGRLAPGQVVWADVRLGQRGVRAKHVVLTVNPPVELCWRDAGWNAVFVSAQRRRTLHPQPDGTVRFAQELQVHGLFASLVERLYGQALRTGMAEETAALKLRAEEAAAPGGGRG